MKNVILSFALIFALFITTGCKKGNDPQVKNTSHKKASRYIPKKSRFSRLRKGMSMRRVTSLIGHPDDTSHFMTGKSFIPFYYGPDRSRTVYYYRHQGEVQFNRRGRLVEIKYNPRESG